MTRKNIDQKLIRELLNYDPETGVFTWKARDRKHFSSQRAFSAWNARYAGSVAGSTCYDSKGYPYINIGIFGKLLKAHRLSWIYMKGGAVPPAIDHIDRDSTNNKWSNLRSGVGVNNKNMSMYRNNSSGVSGVSWHKCHKKWEARAHGVVDGTSKQQYLGRYEKLCDAKTAVDRFRAEHGYTEDHGASPASYMNS